MPGLKVAILGAAGGIGQPLSLLLKQNPLITELALFDVVPVVKGVAVDISHINTPSVVTGFAKDDNGLSKTLKGCDIVVIPAGVPRKPGMTRDDLFNINAGIVRDLATAMAKDCPKAFVCVISNPVNSTVPIVAEVFRKAGVFNPKRLFGVTTLDVVRACQFAAEVAGDSASSPKYKVPVIGGHSGVTILPLLSQCQPALPPSFMNDPAKVAELTKRIQFAGDEVVKAKDGGGSATLSMAYAGFRFAESLIRAKWGGEQGVVEMGYVLLKSDANGGAAAATLAGEADYFAVPIELGPNGVEKILPIGNLSAFEQEALRAAVPELKTNISKGIGFVENAKL
jgi:malate dehydrogenase